MKTIKILIYAFGNPGRMDDGLGCAFVNALKKWVVQQNLAGYEFDCNYQLNIEDAYSISQKDLVIFVDASMEDIESFVLTKVDESSDISFTSHEASPGYIYYLCMELFNKTPVTYLLHLKGYKWLFQERLSQKAKTNLENALDFMKKELMTKENLISDFQNTILN